MSQGVPLCRSFATLGLSFPINKGWATPHNFKFQVGFKSLLILWGGLPPRLLPPALGPAHLLQQLGSSQQLQGLQVRVEEGAGLQVSPQLALDDVAYGAVIRQPDESRGVHKAGATGGQSWAVAEGSVPTSRLPTSLGSSSGLGTLSDSLKSETSVSCSGKWDDAGPGFSGLLGGIAGGWVREDLHRHSLSLLTSVCQA